MRKSNSVGVIIPYHNREEYLAECIDSVLLQDYPHFEVYTVDDGSIDGSRKVVEGYKGLKTAKLDDNYGVAVARNLAASMAIVDGHDYIFCMGSDDRIVPHCLSKMVKRIQAVPNAGFCTPARVAFGTTKGVYCPPTNRSLEDQLKNNALTGACLYKSAVWAKLGGYDVKTYTPFGKATWEDYDMTTRVLQAGYKYTVVREPVYQYRKHRASATESIKRAKVKQQLRKAFERKFNIDGTKI